VKSVDLDVWTPEQMQSVMKWGNARANLYWVAHLKPGHIPPEHKLDSFIRSKYESRRWALEGPPPDDPSALENLPATVEVSSAPAVPAPEVTSTTSPAPIVNAGVPATHGRTHSLLSTARTRQPGVAIPAALATPITTTVPPPVSSAQSDIFSLDFTPTNPQTPSAAKDVKNDILSLFKPAPTTVPYSAPPPLAGGAAPTSFAGQNGTGMWGVQSGWTASTATSPAAADPWRSLSNVPAAVAPMNQGSQLPLANGFASSTPQNVWAAPTVPASQVSPNTLFNTNNVWGSTNPSGVNGITGNASAGFGDLFSTPSAAVPVQAKKDDAFGDLWGDFK